MIRNPFKVAFMACNFDDAVRMFNVRSPTFFNRDGLAHRLNGFASPFWRGYNNEGFVCIEKNTAAHAFYRAGQACRKEQDRNI